MDIYVVDAFTSENFKGNAAAVIPINEWPEETLMQSIASENNLSETAFIKFSSLNCYHIRWFSPLTEVDFCGHATLAAAFILFSQCHLQGEITFITQTVGELQVSLNKQNYIEMRFPAKPPEVVLDIPESLLEGIDQSPIQVLKNRQAYFLVLANEEKVEQCQYDSELLKKLAPLDIVITALSNSDKYDFVSRYFWPANGGDEDPVTGSIHCGLAPYWGSILKKKHLLAYQASSRGGVLDCQLEGQQVIISGKAVLYMQGKLTVQA